MRESRHKSLFRLLVPGAALTGLLAVAVAANAQSWSVTSSIAGGATLAKPVQWSATVVGSPPGGLDRVEFLIDGNVGWIEHNPPFDFNNDGNYLYPYLFARGPHELTVRAVSKSGEQVSATANVQITQTPPRTPRALRATWKRRVDESVIRRNTGPGDPVIPAGVYRDRWGPKGLVLVSPPAAPGITPNLYAFSATAHGSLTLGGSVNWLKAQSALDGICHGPATFGRYRWKVEDRVLTLKAVKDPCPLRRAVTAGRWTRA